MATKRKYAYYIKGNKLAVIQREDALAGSSNDEYGMYKSPTESIADGLEIQYAYSPTYSFVSGGDQTGASRYWRPLGATGASGNRLTFLLPNEDFSSTFTAGDKILVQGSNRWNGVHTVADSSKLGAVITETAYSSGGAGNSSIDVSCDFTSGDKTIIGNGLLQKQEIGALFPEGTHYIFVGITEAAVDTQNNSELFKVTSNGSVTLTATAQYTITSGTVTESTSPVIATRSADDVTLAKVHYDPFYLYPSAEFKLLQDETFELDLSRYHANAVVYYLKAKMAEDAGDFDRRQFFMREFKKQLEKGVSALKRGPYIVQGFKSMT